MMDGFSIKFEGLRELDDKLKTMGDLAAKRIVRDALRAGAEITQAAIQERAPVRPGLPSGTALPPGALAADIELYIGEEDGWPAAIVRPGKWTAYAADWVEYGHRLIKGGYNKLVGGGKHRGQGKEIGEVRAYPFIRPGYEASREAAVQVLVKTAIDEVEKEASR
jgi:HK97 gp10 family phage protein